ncbi:pLS20_p028 family conjugation system transmembrane protein [Furfurilactobacillus entadae]|uniref:pLS20_p028 family conjugation system transmembrane protein n=1 Tax=Furfurilactobacillus entadae TaxID=2922307 RepID=UPI0035F0C15A
MPDSQLVTDGSTNGRVLDFYQAWHQYLNPSNVTTSKILYKILAGVVNGLYAADTAMESIFNAAFKMIGVANDLGSTKTTAGMFFSGLQTLGMSIGICGLIFLIVSSYFGREVKYKQPLINATVVLLVTFGLPWLTSTATTAIPKVINEEQTTSVNQKENDQKPSGLSLQPIQENVVDLAVIAKHDFNYDLDSQGFIKVKNGDYASLNDIGSENKLLQQTDFSATLDDDSPLIKNLDKDDKKPGSILKYELAANSVDDNGTKQYALQANSQHSIVKGLNDVYPEYRVHWSTMIAEQIMLIVMFGVLTLRTLISIYNTFILLVISPLVGLSNLSSLKRWKELMGAVTGAMMSVVLEVVVLRLSLVLLSYAPSADAVSGLPAAGRGIFMLLLYIAVVVGDLTGISAIERYTGVSQSHAQNLQQIAGAGALGMAAGAGAMGAGRAGVNGASKVAGGIGNVARRAPSAINGGINRAATMVGATTQAVAHPVETAKAAGANVSAKAKDTAHGIQSKVNDFGQDVKDSFYGGADKVKPTSDAQNNPSSTTGAGSNGGATGEAGNLAPGAANNTPTPDAHGVQPTSNPAGNNQTAHGLQNRPGNQAQRPGQSNQATIPSTEPTSRVHQTGGTAQRADTTKQGLQRPETVDREAQKRPTPVGQRSARAERNGQHQAPRLGSATQHLQSAQNHLAQGTQMRQVQGKELDDDE